MVKKERLKGIEFSEKSYKFRKFLSVILFLAMLFGWSFLIGYNIYIGFATAQIRVHPQGFSGEYSNSTMNMTGSFVVENDHWNAIAIRDLNISMSISTDNGTKLQDVELIYNIPAGKNTTLTLPLIEFNNGSGGMTIADYLTFYLALNSTVYLHFDVSISLNYGLYAAYLDVKLKTEWGGFI
jgi:hypothetical protein